MNFSEVKKEFPIFEKTWKDFFANNKFSEIHYSKDDQFLQYFVHSHNEGHDLH